MKRFKPIKISKPAEIDLKDIASYTLNNWGSKKKKSYIAQFKKLFLDLSYHIESIKPMIKNRKEIDAGLHSFLVNQHVVYFREPEHEILIVRILHTRMDPEKNLLK